MDALLARRRLLLIASFAAVWFIWGSTYLAIAIGIETMPPFTMAGIRFLLAGAMRYFRYLKTGLALVLMFIGTKMCIDPHGHEPKYWFQVHIPISLSLVVVAAVILISIALSLIVARREMRRVRSEIGDPR